MTNTTSSVMMINRMPLKWQGIVNTKVFTSCQGGIRCAGWELIPVNRNCPPLGISHHVNILILNVNVAVNSYPRFQVIPEPSCDPATNL